MSWSFRLLNTAIMSFLLSGLMTVYVTLINLGFVADFIHYWIKAWILAAPAAFIIVMMLATPVQRLTYAILARLNR